MLRILGQGDRRYIKIFCSQIAGRNWNWQACFAGDLRLLFCFRMRIRDHVGWRDRLAVVPDIEEHEGDEESNDCHSLLNSHHPVDVFLVQLMVVRPVSFWNVDVRSGESTGQVVEVFRNSVQP